MQANPLTPSGTEGPSSQPRHFTSERAVDRAILTKIFEAAIAGAISYVAAIMTTTVESGGFGRYFWLGVCLVTFVFAFISVILAIRHFDVRDEHSGQGG
jgi:uncharacterized membrane protein (DUF485 family)